MNIETQIGFELNTARLNSRYAHAKRLNKIWTIASYVMRGGEIGIEIRNNQTGISQYCLQTSYRDGSKKTLYDNPEVLPSYVKKSVEKMWKQVDALIN